MPQEAYTPIFQIWKGGENVTANFNNRTTQIQVRLFSGEGGGDTCSIVVDDRDYMISTPQVGDGLEVYLGYEEIGLAKMGVFQIDNVVFMGPPKAIQISGTGAKFNGSIKGHVTRNIENKSFEQIVQNLTEGTGYNVNVDSDLGAMVFPFKNINQSPIAAMSTLARDLGGVLKVNGNTITIAKRGSNTTASGESMTTYILNETHVADWRVEHSTRHQFDGATALYRDPDTNTMKSVKADTTSSGFLTQNGQAAGGDKIFDLKFMFQTKELAEAAAKAKMQELDQLLGTATLMLAKGDPWIRDTQQIILTGFRTGVNGTYLTDQVIHQYSKDSGLTTTLMTKPPTSGDSASPAQISGGTAIPDGGVVGSVLGPMPASQADGTPAAQAQYGPGA